MWWMDSDCRADGGRGTVLEAATFADVERQARSRFCAASGYAFRRMTNQTRSLHGGRIATRGR